jgi:glycine/D-amino acid oxidase-like deaminating enzyme
MKAVQKTQKSPRYSLAIIGGGFTGVMLAAQLLRKAPHGTSIALIEKGASLGRGVDSKRGFLGGHTGRVNE